MTATVLTAAAAKANNDNDDGGGGNNDDDDGDGENDDGDDDHLTCNDRIDGGRRGPPAPRGRTAAALLSPSRQLQTPKTRRRTRLCPRSRTEGRHLCPQSRTEGRRHHQRHHRWRRRWCPMRHSLRLPMPTATLTTFFVKLYNYFLINFVILGAAANNGMLVFWGQRRRKGCWRFGGSDERRDVGVLGAWARNQWGC